MNKAFEGDTYIGLELLNLRDKFKIKYCIETGTQYGSSTIALANIFDNVISIEADPSFSIIATERIKNENVVLIEGRSEDVLKLIEPDNVLYYLDAHGCNIGGCPLKKELIIIAGKKHKNVSIAIHDFKVPEKDFGFDSYDFDLSYEEIEEYLNYIYPEGFKYHYNEEADGANRGIIYIYSK
jgi:hypothetical protein